jgi:membrane fusion protein, multidrug efflux system
VYLAIPKACSQGETSRCGSALDPTLKSRNHHKMNDGSDLVGGTANYKDRQGACVPQKNLQDGSGMRQAVRELASPSVLCALLCASLLWATGCGRKEAPSGKGRGAGGAPVPVLTAVVAAEDVPMEIHAIGTVQAYSMVSVRPQITGPLMGVHIQEGQDVQMGDLLFSIDPRPWEVALRQSQANLKRDEAQMTSARLAFMRSSNLFAGKIASQADYDTAEANYQALQGSVLADSAAISNAQVSLGYTTIRSPISGRTGNLNVKAGNVVKAVDDVLLTIAQRRPIYVAFSVPEQQLPAIRRESQGCALPVVAIVPGDTNLSATGELTFINNTVDASTGTIGLKGTFANTNDVLWPGQFVQVSMTLRQLAQATVVPSQAVQTGQDGDYVFVVKGDETVEPRPVIASITRSGKTVIVSGLTPGETVVTDGQMRLVPGAKVSVKPPQGSGTPAITAQAKP